MMILVMQAMQIVMLKKVKQLKLAVLLLGKNRLPQLSGIWFKERATKFHIDFVQCEVFGVVQPCNMRVE